MSVDAFLAGLLGATWLERTAVAFGIAGVFLTVRQKVLAWPVGIVNVLLYTVIFWQARLYADMGLQVVYAVLSAYGWWAWLHGGADHGALRVTRISARTAATLGLLAAAFAASLGTFLARTTDASLPWLDSSLTAASLAAQWMLTRKLLENWLVWIAADIVYVGMFVYKGLQLTAVLYAIFLGLAVMGWLQWRRSLRAVTAP